MSNVNVKEIIGHMVEAEIALSGYFGTVVQIVIGRVVYSEYNASLFFKPKGSRNKGYIINNENDIHSVKIIRKDKNSHEYYLSVYNQKEKFELELEKREEIKEQQRLENERLRKERIELKRKEEKEKKQKEINEAKQLGGYDELEKDVLSFYQSYNDEWFNEHFVKDTVIPLLNKLINKSIENVNSYPKHLFDKKGNPKFCVLIEKKLGIKLCNTQKGNVQILNEYLSNLSEATITVEENNSVNKPVPNETAQNDNHDQESNATLKVENKDIKNDDYYKSLTWKSYEKIKLLTDFNKQILLTSEEEYKNMVSNTSYSYGGMNISLLCNDCKKEYSTRIDVYSKGKTNCNICNKVGRWDYFRIKNMVESNKGELLSTEDEINSQLKNGVRGTQVRIKIVCNICDNTREGMRVTDYYNKESYRRCKYCNSKVLSNKMFNYNKGNWENDEYREKVSKRTSEQFTREKNPNWNPGMTEEERKNRRDPVKIKRLRKEVYERDKYTCQCCGDSTGGNLVMHHLDGFHWAKDLRYDINNCITLCEECHTEYHETFGYYDSSRELYNEFYNMFWERELQHI